MPTVVFEIPEMLWVYLASLPPGTLMKTNGVGQTKNTRPLGWVTVFIIDLLCVATIESC